MSIEQLAMFMLIMAVSFVLIGAAAFHHGKDQFSKFMLGAFFGVFSVLVVIAVANG